MKSPKPKTKKLNKNKLKRQRTNSHTALLQKQNNGHEDESATSKPKKNKLKTLEFSTKKSKEPPTKKVKLNGKSHADTVERVKLLPSVRHSDDPPGRKPLWTNRERVLVLASRGVGYLGRHLMKDLVKMLPHAKTDSKLDTKQNFTVINEIAEMKNATKVLFFESRKQRDLYLWISCVPSGPSMKFLLSNMSTTAELKLTGNCMKTSRPLLSFDESFDTSADNGKSHMGLMRELLVQTLGVPSHHPLSQPFVDKVFTFSSHDDRIWFRNYQIARENSAELAEVGPRFTLQLIKIFSGSFCGSVLYENPQYTSPNEVRSLVKKSKAVKYMNKLGVQQRAEKRKITGIDFDADPTDEIFQIAA